MDVGVFPDRSELPGSFISCPGVPCQPDQKPSCLKDQGCGLELGPLVLRVHVYSSTSFEVLRTE